MYKKYLLAFINLSIAFSTISCGRDATNPSIEIQKSNITVMFNNAYKGLFSENEEIGKKDPNNPDKKFIEIVKNARTSIDGAFYDIENMDFTKALVDAKKRGVKVRVVTDTTNLKREGEIRPTIKLLMDNKIEVKDDKRNPSMHHKFMIIDSRMVWTGSLNITTSSVYHHNNDAILIDSDKLAANYKAEFNRLFEKNMFGPNPHEIPNPEITLSDGSKIKNYFSPEGKTEAAILKEVNAAKKSIRFMAFAFTSKSIADAMIAKNKQKISCEGVYDTCQISKYSTYSDLKSAKIPVYKDGNQALMHEKIMIIDEETVITGSYNFSNNAEHSNNENTLIIKSAAVAKQYTKEFERLKNASIKNTNLPPYDHPACRNNPAVEPTDSE